MTTERNVTLMGGPLDGATVPGPMVVADQTLETGAIIDFAEDESQVLYEPEPGADPYIWHYRGRAD
ncbi:hypothetical protein AB0395_33690 [Streptosporangium sp. NPDC051023]|uniref:hypothetical protein n=1 Tax=Streptosporangium sp. NPDC051023 TaxID=3155410 RepID=UPI00344E8CFD